MDTLDMDPRLRSRSYPVIDLETAQRLLNEQLEGVGTLALTRSAIAVHLGYSHGEGGMAGRKLGALVQFGLLERRTGKYSLSSLGLRMQSHSSKKSERIQTLRTTLQKPPLFKNVLRYIEYIGTVPDDLAPVLAEKFGITEKASGDAAGVFLRSARFAEVLDPWGKLIYPGSSGVHQSVQDSSQTFSLEPGPAERIAAQEGSRWVDYFQLPSRKEGALELPPIQEITLQDCEMLKIGVETWLPTFRRFLDGPVGAKGDLLTPRGKDQRWRKRFLLSARKDAFLDLPAIDRLTVGDHEEIERYLLVWVASFAQHVSASGGISHPLSRALEPNRRDNVMPFRGQKKSGLD
ncbi:MAG TPA: hypothetical protein VN851_28655 [Thermoanaerobaculia bacterium]|nr:hypothetical protein [Thermoanaerobaculia bacterium]